MNRKRAEQKKATLSKKRSPSDFLSLKKTRQSIQKTDELLQEVKSGHGLTAGEVFLMAFEDMCDAEELSSEQRKERWGNIMQAIDAQALSEECEVYDFNLEKRRRDKAC